jgi:hypothetical protein
MIAWLESPWCDRDPGCGRRIERSHPEAVLLNDAPPIFWDGFCPEDHEFLQAVG